MDADSTSLKKLQESIKNTIVSSKRSDQLVNIKEGDTYSDVDYVNCPDYYWDMEHEVEEGTP